MSSGISNGSPEPWPTSLASRIEPNGRERLRRSEAACTAFDRLQDIAPYSDLIRSFGANATAGATHYRHYGQAEGHTVATMIWVGRRSRSRPAPGRAAR